jgi:uncharacterized DUF497 family protein
VQTIIKRSSIDGKIVHENLHNFFTKPMKNSRHASLKSSRSIVVGMRRRVRKCVPYFYRRIDIFTRVISAQGKEIREKQKRERKRNKRDI